MGATSQGTKRFLEKHAFPITILGRTGWSVSPVGFGAYRVHDHESLHEQALKLALQQGCNLIDTSTNYADGGSERLIGRVLKGLLKSGALKRDEVVVVSKAGYVQGENMRLAVERARAGEPFPEMVEYNENCWHCISPEFLSEQITRSLARLELECLDVLLLHNPEYFLKTKPDHAEYYRRIGRALEYLETEVKKGRIQYYGISSNTFPGAKEAEDYTSLESVCDLAQEQGANHHFGVVQFPLNLFEAGAVFEENNSGHTLAALALKKNLGTLVNRPLNAFTESRMVRLADYPAHVGESVSDRFRAAMTRATGLESQYQGKAVVPVQQIAWGHILKENFGRLAEISRWKEILEYQILPSRDEALELLASSGFSDWCGEYRVSSDELFAAFSAMLESEAAIQSKSIASRLDRAAPALGASPTLSRKAIRMYRSVPGIHCVLVGMRRPEYVQDAMSIDPVLTAAEAIAAFRAAAEGGFIEN
ncbi:MAG: aldo/keto reductase [Deltaproteobacteria bacterium]|nr:aldo/keto reductase [Deltaproteobacteria bacterium]